MSRPATSSQCRVHGPVPCTRRQTPERRISAQSIGPTRLETSRTASGASARMHTPRRDDRRLVSLLPQADPQAGDLVHGGDAGASAAQTSWSTTAQGELLPAVPATSGRRLRLDVGPPVLTFQGRCGVRVRAWPYSVDQDRSGLDGVQKCGLGPGEPVLYVFG